MKIVLNKCYGGFGLSKEAWEKLKEWKVENALNYFEDWENDWVKQDIEQNGPFYIFEEDRSNPQLIKLVEELGAEKTSSRMAQLKIVEIPDNIEWEIEEYDGIEWIAEKHRTWG